MIRNLCIGTGAIALFVAGAATRGDAPPKLSHAVAQQEVSKIDKSVTAELAQSCNEFGVDLYLHCVATRIKESDNLVLAPYSLAEALSLVYVGAREKTADEIAKTLHFKIKHEQVGPAFASLGIGSGGYLADGAGKAIYRFGARVRGGGGRGVEVFEVKKNSPAWEAGLRPKDRLVRLGDWSIRNAADYANALDTFVDTLEGEIQDEKGRRRFTARLNVPAASAQQRIRPLIASALWGRKGLEFTPAFKDTASIYYNAAADTVDFATEANQARTRINRWVAANTDDRIRGLLPPDAVTPQTALVLTNAIYFEANWRSRFDAQKTKDETFFAPGQQQQVKMMRKRSSFRYGNTKTFQVLDLLLEGGFAMALFLPTERDGLAAFEKEQLTAKNLAFLVDQLKPHVISVAIPQFQVATNADLQKALSELGMSTPFSSEANFSGMTPKQPIGLSRIVHEAAVEVQEEGVRSTAGTGAVNEPLVPPVAIFKADHPFLFTIRDTRTKVVLFIGRIVSPEAE